ncbi:MAG TPA: class I SAM-dependent methyltransferase [Steroidobacteraceae bacterium]|nr:class I SAM-dependent methyltransferase [Steroidobacteraceae bacterium]
MRNPFRAAMLKLVSTNVLRGFALAFALLSGSFVPSSLIHADEARYETRATHDPDGLGKFYLGREIAHVMGPGGIIWLERAEREREERPQLVLDALQIQPGQTVVDLGCGSGYYAFRMSKLVGPNGKVFAVDIEERMLQFVRQRAQREAITNITPIRSTASDPNLPPESVDLLLMVDVYHELEFPFEVMRKVREALKPGGRVALVEYRAEDPKVMIKEVHKMTQKQIIKEMKAVGLRHSKTITTLPLQHLAIFEKA